MGPCLRRSGGPTIDKSMLALLNLDEDHVRDFDSVMRNCTVPWVLSNPTIGPSEFAVGAPPCSGLTFKGSKATPHPRPRRWRGFSQYRAERPKRLLPCHCWVYRTASS